jgi:dinuclear metal center YbgI/SA1388 family protein
MANDLVIAMPTVADVIAVLELFAPPSSAASWDNVGLLLGDKSGPVDHVLTCLTLTPEVADEAAASGVQLIVTHHPILFRGVKRLTADTTDGRVVLTLAKAGIAVYSPHTAFDDCPGGINDQLAAMLGLNDVKPLRPGGQEECKFVVFVPDADLAKVADAIFAAGAGGVGHYRECSNRFKGTGTFFGDETTHPAVGQKGRREEVEEWRLEAICPRNRIEAVIAAMRWAHSYEVPAFDVFPLVQAGCESGSGRIGVLSQQRLLGDVVAALKSSLKTGPVQIVGDVKQPITKIAIACGAAGEFLDDARKAGADAFLSGEMRFHDYLAAQAAKVALILPGHYATERFAVECLVGWLQKQMPGLTAAPSRAEKDPVNWI